MTTPIETASALGAVIRAERKAQGLRQPDLAAAAGTSVRFIVEIEQGKPTARIGKVLDVLRQLGLEVHVTAAPGSDHRVPGSDHRVPGSDHRESGSDQRESDGGGRG